MPNHVKNIVKMEGITALPLFTEEDGKECFDFNKIIPMPESLNMESGSTTDECIVYYLTERCTIPLSVLGEKAKEVLEKTVTNMFSRNQEWVQTVFQRAMERAYKRGRFNSNKMYNDGRQYVNNYMKYGCTTWYDWCCNNWGTKWNAYSNEQEDEDTISFETAWSNPEPVMLKLSEMYPEAIIEHWWADEDMGNNDGYRVYQGGKIIEGDYCESCSSEAYEIYIKCWGESDCLYQDEDGNWNHYDCDTCHGCD